MLSSQSQMTRIPSPPLSPVAPRRFDPSIAAAQSPSSPSMVAASVEQDLFPASHPLLLDNDIMTVTAPPPGRRPSPSPSPTPQQELQQRQQPRRSRRSSKTVVLTISASANPPVLASPTLAMMTSAGVSRRRRTRSDPPPPRKPRDEFSPPAISPPPLSSTSRRKQGSAGTGADGTGGGRRRAKSKSSTTVSKRSRSLVPLDHLLPPTVPAPVTPRLSFLLRNLVFPNPLPHLADPNHPLSPPSSSGIVAVLKRKWLYHDRAPLDAHSFSVMSWNILAPSFERSNAPGSPSGPRPPSPPPSSPASRERRWAIVTEVLYYEADIVCLQEVDPSDFEAFFSPLLASAGYIGHYASKSAYDGCAMFYRADRFKLASAAPNTLRYRDVPLDGASLDRPDLWTSARPADACTRHSPFGNVAQIAVLRNLATGHRIRVINTHLLWQPELADAKLLQTAILMEHLVAGDVMARGACAGARGAPPSLPPSPALAASDEDELRAALAHRRLPLPIAIPEAAATIRSPPVAAAATVTGLPSPVSPWHPETLASHRAKSGGSAMSPLVIPSAYLPLTPPSPSFIPTSSSRRGTTTSGNKSPKPRHSNARSGSVSPVMRGGDHFARTGGGGTALPVPTVICGDFNSLPDSPVLQLLLAGWVPTEAFGGSQFGRFTCGERYEHSLGLRTAYEVTSLPYTHRVPHFSGMIDHILYSAGPGQLKLMGVLDSADPPGYLEQLESIPAPHVPSDHLPILSILRHQPGHASTSSTASARWH